MKREKEAGESRICHDTSDLTVLLLLITLYKVVKNEINIIKICMSLKPSWPTEAIVMCNEVIIFQKPFLSTNCFWLLHCHPSLLHLPKHCTSILTLMSADSSLWLTQQTMYGNKIICLMATLPSFLKPFNDKLHSIMAYNIVGTFGILGLETINWMIEFTTKSPASKEH